MTKPETKRDVFYELLDAYDDAVSVGSNLHPTDTLLEYDARYDAATQESESEAQKNCPYCHDFTEWSSVTEDDESLEEIHIDEGKPLVNGAWVSASLARKDDGRIGLYVSGDDSSWRQISFCPMCGRRLEGSHD